MKKVFTNSADVIHLFAQQTQYEARCSNVFFYGNKVYSYGHHYLLGEFIDKNTIVINDTGYSVTTSKHISLITGATRQYKQFFETNIDLRQVYNDAKDNLSKLANARKPELYIDPILYKWDKLNEYIKYTKNKTIKTWPEYKELRNIVRNLVKNPEAYKEKLKEHKARERRKKEKEEKKRYKEAFNKFQNYETDYIYLSNEILRVSKDGKFIETSQQVSVPLKESKVLFNLINAGKDVKGFKLDKYMVISINGTLKIGCHNIKRDEINRFAKKLNWI